MEIGKRPFFGLDFRFTELQAAVLLVQLRKLPMILSKLRANKKRYKELISGIPGLEFREITDAEGDIATMLTVILPKAEIAQKIAQELNTKVMAGRMARYSNMEHCWNTGRSRASSVR